MNVNRTRIEWTEAVWNPVTGCTKASPGCKHCYAERMAKRLAGRCGYPAAPHQFDVTLHPERLEEPLRWKKPRMVFADSMSDLFHPDVPVEFILQVFEIMRRASRHTFQVLTKRSDRLVELDGRIKWPANVWMGVSVENDDYSYRIDHLLRTRAWVKFLSCEPLLGSVDLWKACGVKALKPTGFSHFRDNEISWVIVGGESGPGARPMHPDWARSLRDQCQAARVAYFFKQFGEWAPAGEMYDTDHCILLNGKTGRQSPVVSGWARWTDAEDWEPMRRFGKKRAGRLLDGREWSELPERAGGAPLAAGGG